MMRSASLPKRFAAALAFSIAALLCGCSADETTAATLVFEPDEASTPAISLRQQRLDNKTLVLELMGHGLVDVYGIAFRIEVDANVLGWKGLEVSAPWSNAVLSVARQPAPGLVVGSITERGQQAKAISVDDEVLAVIELPLQKSAPSRIDFASDDCAIVIADGSELGEVSWHGGQLLFR